MALLNDVTRGVKSAVKNMSEAIHHSAEINRIKMLIMKEEKKLQGELAKLGTACFEQNKNPELTSDFSEYFKNIEKQRNRIAALQKMLNDLYIKQSEQVSTETSPKNEIQPDMTEITDEADEIVETAETKEMEEVKESADSEEVKDSEVTADSEQMDEHPGNEQFREDTISQLVDVVSEEAGIPDYDSDNEALETEIISRNSD